MTLLERVYNEISGHSYSTAQEITTRLNVHPDQVMSAIKRLHKFGSIDCKKIGTVNQWFKAGPLPELKVRKCLKCGDPFPSRHKGQRVCGVCKSSQTWKSGGDYDTPVNVA